MGIGDSYVMQTHLREITFRIQKYWVILLTIIITSPPPTRGSLFWTFLQMLPKRENSPLYDSPLHVGDALVRPRLNTTPTLFCFFSQLWHRGFIGSVEVEEEKERRDS